MHVASLLASMEARGIAMDTNRLNASRSQLLERIASLEQRAHELAGQNAPAPPDAARRAYHAATPTCA